MPKWRGEFNKVDEPTIRDLQAGRDLEQVLQNEIRDISFELSFEDDIYGGHMMSPEEIFEKIASIREKMKTLPITDKTELEKRIKTQERFIPGYLVDYFSKNVEDLGWRNARNPGQYPYWEDIRREVNFYLRGKDREKYAEVTADLLELIEKTVRYEKEPLAYSFDKKIEELRKELAIKSMDDLYRRINSFETEDLKGLSDGGLARSKKLEVIESFARQLIEANNLIEKMQDQKIISSCQSVVEELKKEIELMDFEERSIDLIAGFQAQVLAYQDVLRQGDNLDKETLEVFYEQITDQLERAQVLGSSTLVILRKLLRNVRSLQRGDADFFTDHNWRETLEQAERTGNLVEAFKILGFDKPEFDKTKVRKAYRELSKRYHPDVKGVDPNNEAFVRISSAYDVVSKVMGWK